MALSAFTNSARKNLDTPRWLPKAVPLNSPNTGMQLVGDLRNNGTRHPVLYQALGSANGLNVYNPLLDDWLPLALPGFASTGAGQCAVFHPSQGPRGTIAAGATTTSLVLSTALPAAVGVNQLANRGDGVGFILRVVDNAAGGSGKIAEVVITANSGGVTPTLYWSGALSFTPATGSIYEILSGRLFLLGNGAAGSGVWKYYDVATNSYAGTLAFTNLPTIGTDSNLIALSELHVPYNQSPSGGYYGNLISTAVAAGTITGQAAAGDAAVFANQWRNFQIRVVQDLTNKTAVGQRRRITSHTAGASPVYTLASNWTVTPAVGALYVIENDDDKILLFTSGQTAVYNYNIAANTWDTTTWAAAIADAAGNVAAHAFGIVPDVGAGALNSQVFRFRGGAVVSVDVLDIAAGANGVWSNAVVYGGSGTLFGTGTSGCYDPWMHQGRFVHLNPNGLQHNARFDLLNRVLEPETYIPQPVSTAQVGCRHAVVPVLDPLSTPPTVMSLIFQISPGQAFMNALPVFPTT